MKCFFVFSLLLFTVLSFGQNTFPASGNVGIGTNSPNAMLDVKYNGSAFLNLYRATDNNNQYRWRIDQGFDMYLTNSSSNDIVKIGQSGSWFNSGNVGIGSNSPLNGLHVFKMNDFNGGSIRFGFSGSNDGVLSLGYNPATGRDALKLSYFPHNSNTGQVDLLTLDTNGSVGIGNKVNGTSSDFEALSVYNTTNSNLASGNGAVIQFYNNSNAYNVPYGASIKSVSANNQYGWESDLYLRTTRNNSYSSQTILDALVVKGSSGNIGIGTTSPGAKLEVNGDISLPSSTGNKQIYTWSPYDPNWRIGMSANPGFTTSIATSNVQYLTYYSAGGQGFALGVNGGQSSFEIAGSNHQAFFRGNVGIGTTTPDAKLSVKGQVHAQEVKVDLNGAVAPDYVFEPSYNLSQLDSIKTYIDKNKHLPEVPSAKEMEKDGVNLGEMNMLLLKKIEELTLYVIEAKKENESLKTRIEKLESKK